MARFEAPVMNTRRRAPAASASSTAYWISGLSTTGSISLGLAFVAGRKRVPRPATGNTAVRMALLQVLIAISPKAVPRSVAASGCGRVKAHASSRGAYGMIGALGPLEDRRPQAVPG